jgi:hypothetical protein
MSDTDTSVKLSDINTLPTLSAMRLQQRDAKLVYESETKRVYVLEPNYPSEATQVVGYGNAGEGWIAMKWVDLGRGHPFERMSLREFLNSTPLPKSQAATKPASTGSAYEWKPSWSKPTTAAVSDSVPVTKRDTAPVTKPAPVTDLARDHINSLFGNLNRK